jgi:hypothetical protein
MFSFLYWKKEENTIKSIWEKILQNIETKKAQSNLVESFNSFYKLIKVKSNNKIRNK